jgi:hypothetical protein
MIFSPCVFIFSLLGHAINCSTFTGGVRGNIFFPSMSMFSPCVCFSLLAMLYGIYFTFLPRQLLGYELEEKQYNNFPPWSSFFPTCDRKTCKKINRAKKNGSFPHLHIFPPWTMLYLVPLLSYSTELRCMKMMIFTTWLKCTFFCV